MSAQALRCEFDIRNSRSKMSTPRIEFGTTDSGLEPAKSVSSPLEWAHPIVQEWFKVRFGSPTEPQAQGWPHILAGRSTLISAPTGSGKTLAAFLACIDRLVRKALQGELQNQT